MDGLQGLKATEGVNNQIDAEDICNVWYLRIMPC